MSDIESSSDSSGSSGSDEDESSDSDSDGSDSDSCSSSSDNDSEIIENPENQSQTQKLSSDQESSYNLYLNSDIFRDISKPDWVIENSSNFRGVLTNLSAVEWS